MNIEFLSIKYQPLFKVLYHLCGSFLASTDNYRPAEYYKDAYRRARHNAN